MRSVSLMIFGPGDCWRLLIKSEHKHIVIVYWIFQGHLAIFLSYIRWIGDELARELRAKFSSNLELEVELILIKLRYKNFFLNIDCHWVNITETDWWIPSLLKTFVASTSKIVLLNLVIINEKLIIYHNEKKKFEVL